MATASRRTATNRDLEASNSEFFSIAHNADFQVGSNDYYGCCWINAESSVTAGPIFTKWDDSGSKEYQLYWGSADSINFRLRDNGGSGNATATIASLSTGTDYFVEWYYNHGDLEIGIAINGGAYTTDAVVTAAAPTTVDVRIGRSINNTDYFDGNIWGLGIWKGTSAIPDAAKRARLYNGGAGLVYEEIPTADKTDMIAFYEGNETSGDLIDSHTNGYDMADNATVGSAAGGNTYTALKAAQFVNANTESLSITDGSQTGLSPGSADFYMACWVYMDNTTGTQYFMSKFLATGDQREYTLYSNAGVATFLINDDGAGASNVTVAGATLSASTWYFIEAIHDNGTNIKISVNRSTDSTTAHTTGAYQGTGAFVMGDRDGGGTGLDGRIAGAVFYNTIPSTATRDALFNGGKGLSYDAIVSGSYDTGLVSHWELNEASGTRSDSVTASGNDLTDNNTVTQADGVVIAPPFDPAIVDSNTKVLLHMDGTDGSTTFTDDSDVGATWTASGNAQIDTAYAWFGTGSMDSDGTGDYISTSNASAYETGANDFYFSFNMTFDGLSDFNWFIDRNADSNNSLQLYRHTNTNFVFFVKKGGSNVMQYYVSWSPSDDVRYNVVWERYNDTMYCYINGVSQTLTEGVSLTAGEDLDIGTTGTYYLSEDSGNANRNIEGWMDEYIQHNAAIAQGKDFTPPIAAFSVAPTAATVKTGLMTMMGIG
jgi:hypothetical protein